MRAAGSSRCSSRAEDLEDRFAARERGPSPGSRRSTSCVENAPADHLSSYADRLAALSQARPDAVRLPTRTGDLEGTYAALVAAVG